MEKTCHAMQCSLKNYVKNTFASLHVVELEYIINAFHDFNMFKLVDE